MDNPLGFIAGRGTSFEIDGPTVLISRDEFPVLKIPFVDLLEFAKCHGLKAIPATGLFSAAQNNRT